MLKQSTGTFPNNSLIKYSELKRKRIILLKRTTWSVRAWKMKSFTSVLRTINVRGRWSLSQSPTNEPKVIIWNVFSAQLIYSQGCHPNIEQSHVESIVPTWQIEGDRIRLSEMDVNQGNAYRSNVDFRIWFHIREHPYCYWNV